MPPEAQRARRLSLAPSLARPLVLLTALALAGERVQAQPESPPWYQVEVLVFQHDSPARVHREEEAWPSQPTLGYPPVVRHLFEPQRAEAALAAVPGGLSHVDALGRQTVFQRRWFEPETLPLLPWRFDPGSALYHSVCQYGAGYGGEYGAGYADALPRATACALADWQEAALPALSIADSPVAPALSLEALLAAASADAVAASTDTVPEQQSALAEAAPDQGPGEPLETQVPAAPPELPLLLPPAFTALPERALGFRAAAARMRARDGWQVWWHRAWLQPMPEEAQSIAIAVDDSGDRSVEDWPALQGSLRLYLSRYLHLQASVWLNTDGRYLQAEAAQAAQDRWRMPAAPRAEPSQRQAVLERSRVPQWPLDLEPTTASATAAEHEQTHERTAEDWPWRHAVLLEQNRRMRSAEVHYIDHPVLGIIIRLTPLDEDALRQWHATFEAMPWAGRHQRGRLLPLLFPAEQLPLPAALQALQLDPG